MLYNVYVNFEIRALTRSVVKRGKEKTKIFKNICGYYAPMVKAESVEAAEQKIREKIIFLAKENRKNYTISFHPKVKQTFYLGSQKIILCI